MPTWILNKSIRTPLLLLAVSELLLLYFSLTVTATYYCAQSSNCDTSVNWLDWRGCIFALVLFASLIATGLYGFHQRFYYREVVARIVVGFFLGGVFLATMFWVIPWIDASTWLILLSLFVGMLVLLTIRFFFTRNVDDNAFRRQTLVYGAGDRSKVLHELRRKADRRGFKIVGSVPAPGDRQELAGNGSLLRAESLFELAVARNVDEIVIAMDDRRGNLPVAELLKCKMRGIEIVELLEFMERETGKIRLDLVEPGWLIFSSGFDVSRVGMACKRLIDIFVSAIILLLTWPFMLLIALAIKIEDGPLAPVFYRQTRVGYRGRPFKVLKFRSMCVDAEADGKAVWASEDDGRVTGVGYCLRKFRLDELPQAINVILGQMSLVGPRPERPEFVEQLSESIPYYMERHSVQPGVTGWAQIRYTYGASEEDALEKLQYDLYYAKNHNILLDLVVILQTVEVILWSKGAR